jgi:cysteinyl-tRNA synthetase
MELYNTETGRRELLRSVEDSRSNRPITIYACGITPYDRPHLGHAATAIRCAVLRRFLKLLGYSVTFVQNVTDIDDKIVNRAKQRGEDPAVIATRYTEEYQLEMSLLGVPVPDREPRVTEHLATIIEYIEKLINGGHAYQVPSGDIYFSIASAPAYGKLAGHDTAQLLSGTRAPVRKEKKHALDFVLWKSNADPIGTFDSPWGRGRPGWHTECCAMSNSILGDTLDIHCGGLDLLFPHHENELVQAECHNHAPFVRSWFHLGLMLIDGVKMSKSEGNVVTIQDARERWGIPLIVYNILSVHYRSPINVREKIFEERLNNLVDLFWFDHQVAALAKVHHTTEEKRGHLADGAASDILESDEVHADELRSRCIDALSNDLNTPLVLAAMHEAVQRGIVLLSNPLRHLAALVALRKELRIFGETLLLFPPSYSFERVYSDASQVVKRRYQESGTSSEILTLDELHELLEKRDSLRAVRRFPEADALRHRIAQAGITCLDGSPRRWRFSTVGGKEES